MSRRAVPLVLCFLLFSMPLVSAGANSQTKNDPQDAYSAMPLDIRKAIFDHTSKKLVVKTVMWKRFKKQGETRLWVRIDSLIYRAAAKYTDGSWNVQVHEVSTPDVTYEGKGSAKKSSRKSLTIKVPRKVVGAAKGTKLEWSVSTNYIGGECDGSGCDDWIPNGAGWFTHKL